MTYAGDPTGGRSGVAGTGGYATGEYGGGGGGGTRVISRTSRSLTSRELARFRNEGGFTTAAGAPKGYAYHVGAREWDPHTNSYRPGRISLVRAPTVTRHVSTPTHPHVVTDSRGNLKVTTNRFAPDYAGLRGSHYQVGRTGYGAFKPTPAQVRRALLREADPRPRVTHHTSRRILNLPRVIRHVSIPLHRSRLIGRTSKQLALRRAMGWLTPRQTLYPVPGWKHYGIFSLTPIQRKRLAQIVERGRQDWQRRLDPHIHVTPRPSNPHMDPRMIRPREDLLGSRQRNISYRAHHPNSPAARRAAKRAANRRNR